MPELPEVETVRSGLEAVLAGRRFVRVEQRRVDLRFPLPELFAERLTGRRVIRIGRRAKYILVHLDRGEVLARARVPVLPDDDPDRLAARVLEVEHRLLPAVVLAAARAGHPVPIPEPVESHP